MVGKLDMKVGMLVLIGLFGTGAEQARNLGVWLREHYLPEFRKTNALFSLHEAPEKSVALRTTNFLRTNLTGMSPF